MKHVTIDGKTRTCGLIGRPVEHTMSPAIHNTLAMHLDHNLVYVPFLVQEGELEHAIKGAYALNVLGLNVTVPYKSDVMNYLVDIDPLAAKIGAVNTLVRIDGGYKGFNTDMTGLYRAMQSEGIRVQDEKVILLGAGGAARAVAHLCAFYGAKKIYLLNRSIDKAEKIAQEVNSVYEGGLVEAMRLDDYNDLPEERMLAIQATSVGLSPNDTQVVIDAPDFYKRVHTGYDLIYRPLETQFMKLVRKNGGKAYHGLKMLLYQGIIAYEYWNQVSVSEKLADVCYEVMKETMGIKE